MCFIVACAICVYDTMLGTVRETRHKVERYWTSVRSTKTKLYSKPLTPKKPIGTYRHVYQRASFRISRFYYSIRPFIIRITSSLTSLKGKTITLPIRYVSDSRSARSVSWVSVSLSSSSLTLRCMHARSRSKSLACSRSEPLSFSLSHMYRSFSPQKE